MKTNDQPKKFAKIRGIHMYIFEQYRLDRKYMFDDTTYYVKRLIH